MSGVRFQVSAGTLIGDSSHVAKMGIGFGFDHGFPLNLTERSVLSPLAIPCRFPGEGTGPFLTPEH